MVSYFRLKHLKSQQLLKSCDNFASLIQGTSKNRCNPVVKGTCYGAHVIIATALKVEARKHGICQVNTFNQPTV